jgi:hypothetical protein
LARTCSGLSSPGGTAATVTPVLPNSIVDSGLIVAPFFGETKKTRAAGAVDCEQPIANSVSAAMIIPFTTRLPM